MNSNPFYRAFGLLNFTMAFVAPIVAQAEVAARVRPHSVPLEFASDRFGVTVNGNPGTGFFAAMNIHFASFDFSGDADVRVKIKNADYNLRADSHEPTKACSRSHPRFAPARRRCCVSAPCTGR